MLPFFNQKELVVCSNQSQYQKYTYKRHFCVAKCLLGCAQTPFVLHRADAGCAFFRNASIYIR